MIDVFARSLSSTLKDIQGPCQELQSVLKYVSITCFVLLILKLVDFTARGCV